MPAGKDALLKGAQHTQNAEGWRLTEVPFNLASGATIANITGIVKIRNVVGRCTTVLATSSSLQLLISDSTITASTDIVGHTTVMILARESATNAVLTEVSTPVASLWAAPTELVVGRANGSTTLEAKLNASGTGVINWTIEWTPLSSNAAIVAAQT